MRLRAWFLPALFLLSWACAADPSAVDTEQRLKLLRQRIGSLQTELHKDRGERDQLSRDLRKTERQIGRLARRLRVIAGQLTRQHQRVGELRRREAQQLADLDLQRQALERQVRSAYAMGRQERIKILLNQQDPALVSRMMAYYDYLNRARAVRMRRIQKSLGALRETRLQIQAQETRLLVLRAEQQRELAKLEPIRRQRKAVVEELTAELADSEKELGRLQRDEQGLAKLLQGIQRALADIPATLPQQKRFALLKGKLPWPSAGQLVARFGQSRAGAVRWDGVMIGAPEGREVRAIHHGRVAYADWLRGFGLLLIVDHGDGYMSLYGHNQSLFKETGDWVEAGEPVALVGVSGGQRRSGVYFGIRFNGKAVNPVRWCRRPRGRRVG